MPETDLWSDLLGCLDLDAGSAPAEFAGRNQRLSYHRLFGGQLLAQFVRAASLACPDKAVKSLHVLFPRAGRSDEPVRYEVERHHEGGTFATLTAVARQSAGVAATASVSMHASEDGPEHQAVPEALTVPGREHRVELDLLPWETRSAVDLDSPKPRPPELDLWMRVPSAGAELAPALAA
jgi:acyl-CoA thioesterase-2